ncbi:hypothetical protein BDV97DRAFT_366063 [Delphinella strobiligena]|nr:hypothetical protein BDV97DRAFT_366063 [Delphinella strobiligena]
MTEGQSTSLRDRAVLARLEKPEDLNAVLARENAQYDCTSCRVMGASAFIGLGAYTYWSGHRQLRLNEQQIVRAGKVNMAARRMGITGLAITLAGIGAYRAFN